MTKIMKKILPLLLMIFSVSAIYAQSGTVTGVVRDRQTGETLPGANVLIQGTTTGAITDINGRYTLAVPAGQLTLVASFIGYNPQTQTVTVGAGQTITLNFSLAEDIALLQEFVLIGYGVQRREDATGSVSVVDTRDFNKGSITNPVSLMAGKIPGVQITSGGGAPGEGAMVRIRGGSSLSASNTPLYVVDGVPIETAGVPGLRSPLTTINPNDIESFTVLKDASATAIYGSRASNGVIIITTKKGKEGAPLRFDYTGTYSLSTNAKTVDVLGADEYRDIINQRYGSNASIIGMLGTESTNWQDQIFRDAFTHDHNLSASGAVGKLPFRASLGYNAQDGILLRDNFQRVSGAVNLSPTFLDDHLKVNVNARGVNIENQFANQGAIGAAVMFDPTKPVRDPDSPFGGFFTWEDGGIPKPVATSNPVALLELTNNQSSVQRFIGNAQVEYKFHVLPELRANLNMAYDFSTSEGTSFTPDNAAWSYINGGYDGQYGQDRKNELIDFYLNYVTELPSISSRLDVMAGYSWQHFWREGFSRATNIEGNLAGTPFRELEDITYASESYLISFFGRMNYSLLDRYLLTFTLRNDGSSRFSPDTRWGLFPSAAFAWKITEEPFMADADLFSELKLRVGYGITGQENIGQGEYPYLARYTQSRQGAFFQWGQPGNFIPTWRPEGYDANLKWEETTTFNIGFDYGIARDRYYGTFDYYFRETRDLINFISVPAGTNLTNFILTNIGNMENTGVEFSIFTRPVVTRDFNWLFGFNATWNDTKITKLTAVEDPNYLGVQTGGISGGVGNNIQIHTVDYAPNSFFVWQQVYDVNGNPIEGLYVDRNGDGEITEADLYRLKRPAPTYYFGITSDMEYRNWNLSFAGRANVGNFVYNNVSSMNGELSRLHRPEGPYLSNITRDALTIGFNNAQYLSDFFIQDGSFFKMDHISLGYNFQNALGSGTNLFVSGVVQNAFVLTNYKGMDPEVAGGIDNNIYPRPRNFVLSVNLQF
jgi:TonB-dependent starch-binding outer membrane protein SusC